jgi:hypothetical protein
MILTAVLLIFMLDVTNSLRIKNYHKEKNQTHIYTTGV